MTRARPDTRVRELAAIHVAAKQLGLDRATYEVLLTHVAGVRSSADLDTAGRRRVLDEMRRLGAERPATRTPRGKAQPGQYPGKPHNAASQAMPETISKIEAQLADMGLTWSYADAIARRMFGIARIAWLRDTDKLAAIVAALHVEQDKRGLLAHVEAMHDKLGITGVDWEHMIAGLPKGWQRNRRALNALIDYLEAAPLERE